MQLYANATTPTHNSDAPNPRIAIITCAAEALDVTSVSKTTGKAMRKTRR